MAVPYSIETVRSLEHAFREQSVLRPFRRRRYEPGDVLDYEVRGVLPDGRGRVKLEIDRFVGGGYAGQVYLARLLELEKTDGDLQGLETGKFYALKILIPASGLSRRVRNMFYAFGFQGPFSLQVTPAAGRSQALWQKFIRRAAAEEFGSPDRVVDIIATLVDRDLGACGEISEWVDGRTWRFEVDDGLDARRAWRPGHPEEGLGSPEYRAKRAFMDGLVKMMHRMGAVELARQYEWWSLKSQPNALKRTASESDPKAGLTAVDFRAGMALTPVTPQCPADIKLVLQGIARGRLVQFDKGDLGKLEKYVSERPRAFAGMEAALGELKREDRAYRDSLIDLTYHHIRLFGGRLRHSIMNGFRQSWRIRNMTDEKTGAQLEQSGFLSLIFLLWPLLTLAAPILFIFAWPGHVWWKYLLWLVPLFLAPFLRRLWGRADLRRHYGRMATNPRYFLRASRARIAEALIRWHRAGRISAERALKIAGKPVRYSLHLPFRALPPGFHRFFTDKAYFKERLRIMFVRPVKLFFNAEEREKWLLDMIVQGQGNRLLQPAEADRIRAQVKEPFIQKYLKSLAVHLATLFISETVYVIVAVVYVLTHPELTWQQATLHAGVIVGALNLLPISPGSLVRGIYVVGLMIKERNFRDYNIAFGLSFLKIIGYLAFPIQMTYRYPDLARFMAGHWATEAVHVVPVFGERGAWLEHFVFDAFYNYPLTVRKRIKRRAELREHLKPRAWPAPLLALVGAGLLAVLHFAYAAIFERTAGFGRIWWLAIWVPFLAGAIVSLWAGGMRLGKRIFQGTLTGGASGLLYGLLLGLGPRFLPFLDPAADANAVLAIVKPAIQYALLFGLIATAGAVVAETRKVKP